MTTTTAIAGRVGESRAVAVVVVVGGVVAAAAATAVVQYTL